MNLLSLIAQESEAIGVGVSFGKDSLATLDLCCRVFSRVEGYYLYRVANMRIVEEWADEVRARHGVDVRMYPHFDLSRCYRSALFQPDFRGTEETPQVKMADIENAFRREANVDWLAMGWRRNDSFSRALIMRKTAGYDPDAKRVFPLRSWRRQDVMAYLRRRNIPEPNDLGRKEQGGLDFHPAALKYLREHYPDDYDRWLRDFPFAELQMH